MNYVMMPIPESMFTSVCALIGGVSPTAVAASTVPMTPKASAEKPITFASKDIENAVQIEPETADEPETTIGDVDAHGWPWSADLHASTKGQTKDGLWRMKVGVTRPDPKPGFPKADAAPTADSPASDNGAASEPSTPAVTATEDDDEFAAFRAAAAASDATPATIPARKWTDADLAALCNQAAVKLGDPAPVKAIIAEHVPSDQVPHSRNIPDDKRDEFARAVETKFGIEFAG